MYHPYRPPQGAAEVTGPPGAEQVPHHPLPPQYKPFPQHGYPPPLQRGMVPPPPPPRPVPGMGGRLPPHLLMNSAFFPKAPAAVPPSTAKAPPQGAPLGPPLYPHANHIGIPPPQLIYPPMMPPHMLPPGSYPTPLPAQGLSSSIPTPDVPPPGMESLPNTIVDVLPPGEEPILPPTAPPPTFPPHAQDEAPGFSEDDVGAIPEDTYQEVHQDPLVGNHLDPMLANMPFDSPGQRQPPIRQEEVAIKPYKRKTPATTSYDEEQIKPSASLYQTRPQTQRNANPKPAFKIPAYPREDDIGPQMRPGTQQYTQFPQERSVYYDGSDQIAPSAPASGVGVLGYQRRTFTVEDSIARRQQAMGKGNTNTAPNAMAIASSTAASIREKLASGGKISKRQEKLLHRDASVLSTIAMPKFVSHRVGSGLTQDEINKAQDEHTRKLLGWKYHNATKANEEKKLQVKRQKRKEGGDDSD